MELISLFFKFAVVGASGVLVNLAIYSLLIYLDTYYLFAAVAAFVFAVSNNFYWNFIWTFKDKAENKSVKEKYLHFFLISFINFLINISVLRILVDSFAVHKILAQIIAIGTAFIFNFFGNYLITFKEKD
jgi:dolichol-phosphate mannosyltransferase